MDFLREVGQGYRYLVKEGCELLLGNKDLTLCLLHTDEDEHRMHFIVAQLMRLPDCYGLLRIWIRTFQFIAFIAECSQTRQCITERVHGSFLSRFREYLTIRGGGLLDRPQLKEDLSKIDHGDPFEIVILHGLTKSMGFKQGGASLLEVSHLYPFSCHDAQTETTPDVLRLRKPIQCLFRIPCCGLHIALPQCK